MKKKNCKNGNNKDLYNKDINININTKSFEKLGLALYKMKECIDESLKKSADIIQEEAIKKTPYVPTGSLSTWFNGTIKDPKIIDSFFPFVPSDLGIDDDYDHLSFSPTAWINNTSFDKMFEEAKRKHEAGEPIGLVTDWKIDIPEEKKKQKFPKLGESRNIEVNYTIEDPDFCKWLQDIARGTINDTVALNPEADPVIRELNPYTPKDVKWVIDDLVPEDRILCFDKRAVHFGVDKDGKHYVRIDKKAIKKMSVKKEENKNE